MEDLVGHPFPSGRGVRTGHVRRAEGLAENRPWYSGIAGLKDITRVVSGFTNRRLPGVRVTGFGLFAYREAGYTESRHRLA